MRFVAKEAQSSGCQVFTGSCDELSEAFPLLPLLDALDPRSPVAAEGRAKVLETLRSDGGPGNRVDLVTAAGERFLALIDQLSAVGPVVLGVDRLPLAGPAAG